MVGGDEGEGGRGIGKDREVEIKGGGKGKKGYCVILLVWFIHNIITILFGRYHYHF